MFSFSLMQFVPIGIFPKQINKHWSTFLWRVCWRTYKKSLICGAIIKILSDLSSLIGPVSIGYILDYIASIHQTEKVSNGTSLDGLYVLDTKVNIPFLYYDKYVINAYVVAVIVLISTLLQATLSNNFNHLVISEGIHLKTALNVCLWNVWKL